MSAAKIEKLAWYLNRLRSMPPQEILHRFFGAFSQRYWVRHESHSVKRMTSSNSQVIAKKFATYIREFSDDQPPSISFLGIDVSEDELRFNMDVRDKKVMWPKSQVSSIDYKFDDDLDPRWNWEINRLLFLLPYVLSEESKSRQFGKDQLNEWLDKDSPNFGVHWSGGIEVGARAIALTVMHGGLRYLDPHEVGLMEKIELSVNAHFSFLKRHASKYSSANNHRIVELVAILVLTAHWDFALGVRKLRRLEDELAELSSHLFFGDGIFKEQSTTYSAFTLEFLALAVSTREWLFPNNLEIVRRVLFDGLSALSAFTSHDGRLISIGDNDEGRLFSNFASRLPWVDSICEFAGIPKFGFDEKVRTFPSGGYTVFKSASHGLSSTLILDHGPFGLEPLFAHAHDDGLSIWLVANGQELVLEPGCYSYHRERAVRNFFRSRAAHNGPLSRNQSLPMPTGAFNWGKWKPVYGLFSSSEASNARPVFAKLLNPEPGSSWVSRQIETTKKPHGYLVTDGTADRGLTSRFLIHSSLSIIESSDTEATFSSDESNLVLSFKLTPGTNGTLSANAARYSPRLGTHQACTELVIETLDSEVSYTINVSKSES